LQTDIEGSGKYGLILGGFVPICILLPAHLSKHLLPVIIQGTFGNSRQSSRLT
jgi:hypothetical protein